MNDIMSFGIHRTWKTKLLDWMNPQLNNSLIDVASGTGDIAKKFSIEKHFDNNSFGGHQIWYCVKNIDNFLETKIKKC